MFQNDYNCELELLSLRTIINEIGAYVFTKDLNGCYTFVNELVLQLFDSTLDEVIGKDDSHFFDCVRFKEIKENDFRVLRYGETIQKEEISFVKSTGNIHIYWTVKKPLFDSTGKIVGMCGISTDITHRKKLEKQLEEKNKLLNTILNNIDAYIYMKDDKRNFQYANEKVVKVFGYKDSEDVIGKKDTDILPKEVADQFWKLDKKVFNSQKKQMAEEVFPNENGEIRHYWSIKLPFTSENGKNSLIGFSTDITELQILKEELKQQSITDYLTGAYNRRYFVEVCEKEFNRSRRYNFDLSIIMLDIDLFKEINDKYGHIVGDEVLKELAKRCKKLKREEDTFFRIGGEEFAIILPHTNLQESEILAKRLQSYQNENLISGNFEGKVKITFSIGISSINSKDTDYEEIFKRADDALYIAKNSGRNKICIK